MKYKYILAALMLVGCTTNSLAQIVRPNLQYTPIPNSEILLSAIPNSEFSLSADKKILNPNKKLVCVGKGGKCVLHSDCCVEYGFCLNNRCE